MDSNISTSKSILAIWNLIIQQSLSVWSENYIFQSDSIAKSPWQTFSHMGTMKYVKIRMTADNGVLVCGVTTKISLFLYKGHSWAATAGQNKINCNITVVISVCSTEQQDICYPETPLVLCRNGRELAYVFRMPRACSSSCLLCWT